MRTDRLIYILYIILLGIGLYVTVRYFWPLLLLIGIMIAFGLFRLRKITRDTQKQMERMEQEASRNTGYQSDLFYEQVEQKQEAAGEIVDVEFTRKEETDRKEKTL